MASNKTLSARNNDALDEWYTQLLDIEEVVAALLKVDPKGIVGKDGKAARKKPPPE